MIDELILATTTAATDAVFEKIAAQADIQIVRGSEDDVVSRMMDAVDALSDQPDIIVRACCDNPLVMPTEVDAAIQALSKNNADIVTPFEFNTLPFGYSMVAMTMNCLERINRDATEKTYREHVENFCFERPHEFKIHYQIAPAALYGPDISLTLDYESDYQRLLRIAESIKDVPIDDQPEKLIDLVKSRRVGVIVAHDHTKTVASQIITRLVGTIALIVLIKDERSMEDAVRNLADSGAEVIVSSCPISTRPSKFPDLEIAAVNRVESDRQASYALKYVDTKTSHKTLITQNAQSSIDADEFLISCLPHILLPLLAGSIRLEEVAKPELPPPEKQGSGERDGFSNAAAASFPPEIILLMNSMDVSEAQFQNLFVKHLIRELKSAGATRLTIVTSNKHTAGKSLQEFRASLAKSNPDVTVYITEDFPSVAKEKLEVTAFSVVAIDENGTIRIVEEGELKESVGKIGETSISEIWQNKPMRQARARSLNMRLAA
tara:strand:- start:3779 stop:5257 length:1479 start_codon:yes stop_codon:yes gene_type:complete